MTPEVTVIIPAAGESSRLGLDCRKPFVELRGQAILLRTVSRFSGIEGPTRMIVALHADDLDRGIHTFGRQLRRMGVTDLVAGGRTRMETVRKCLELIDDDCTIVVVHDGARPLVSHRVIAACIRRARECGAAVAAVRMRPTVKAVDGRGMVSRTVGRKALWAAQTPQAFRRDVICAAYKELARGKRGADFTDDAAVVERFGGEVAVVEDLTSNIKITTREDLVIAEALLAHEGE